MSKFGSFTFYCVVYGLSALFLNGSRKKKKIDIFVIIAVLLPVLLAGLRYKVGTDFDSYGYMYEELRRLPLGDWVKNSFGKFDASPFGIWLLAKVASLFGSVQWFYALMGAMTAIPAVAGIKYLFPEHRYALPYFIFLFGTFNFGLNGSKQAIAAAVIFYSMRYVLERRPWLFFLSILIAMQFHPTAVCAVPIYFAYAKNHSWRGWHRILLVIGCVAMVFLYDRFLSILGGRFEDYTDYGGTTANRSFYLNLIWLILFAFFGMVIRKKLPQYDTFLFVYFLGTILALTGFASPYVKRIAEYYTFADIYLLTYLPSAFKGKSRLFVNVGVVAYTVALFAYTAWYLGQASIIPYRFYWI